MILAIGHAHRHPEAVGMLLLLLSPPVALLVWIVRWTWKLATGRVPGRLLTRAWGCLSVGLLGVTGPAYGAAWFMSTPFRAVDQTELCALRSAHSLDTGHTAHGLRGVERHQLPPGAVCRWDDGTGTELVPFTISAVFLGSLSAAAVTTALAARAYLTTGRRTLDEQESHGWHRPSPTGRDCEGAERSADLPTAGRHTGQGRYSRLSSRSTA